MERIRSDRTRRTKRGRHGDRNVDRTEGPHAQDRENRMAKQLYIYEDARPISAARHGAWSVKTGADYRFAAELNSCPLLVAEFSEAARAYPIVFIGGDEAVMPIAVLGARDRQNLHVDGEGQWTGGYLPAFLRQYPFVFAQTGDENRLALCIDEAYSGCNTDGRGERLFDSEGVRTAYLERMLAFAQQYQQQFRLSQAFGTKLRELDLLEPMRATFRRNEDGQTEQLSGFLAVKRDGLADMDEATLADLHRRGWLEAIHLHLHAMGNFRGIGDRLTSPDPTAAEPAPEAPAETAVPEDATVQ
jgi:hypothetical protein